MQQVHRLILPLTEDNKSVTRRSEDGRSHYQSQIKSKLWHWNHYQDHEGEILEAATKFMPNTYSIRVVESLALRWCIEVM
ncbi:hypothetical protein JHK84_031291 [Glycine max]|nr:hypothetical protein JHK84_031291 [Glycine max]